MFGAPDYKVQHEKTIETVYEHSTVRSRENEYLVRKIYYNESPYQVHSGTLITQIREESRNIYKIDGKYVLFFDLDKSETFRKMKRDTTVDLKEYLFSNEQLSLFPKLDDINDETDMRTIEREIDKQMEYFDSFVSNYIGNPTTHNQSEHDPISEGAVILDMDDVRKIVHNDSFLKQQNRDLYREFLHVACLLVPEKSEIASNVTLSWQQDLETALFHPDFVQNPECIDSMRLMHVMDKLINCIQVHDRLDNGRKLQKDLLTFSRKNKVKALKDRKDAITQAWITYPGFKHNRVSRENELAKIQAAFFAATKWQKVKYDWEVSRNRHITAVRTEQVNRDKKYMGDGNGDSNNSWADRVEDEGEMSFDDIDDNKSRVQTMRASLASAAYINPYII